MKGIQGKENIQSNLNSCESSSHLNTKPGKKKILFIGPFGCTLDGNTAGIAYLKGFLDTKNIKSTVCNFNKILFDNKFFVKKFKKYLRTNIKNKSLTQNMDNLFLFLANINFELSSDELLKLSNTDIFDEIFDEYINDIDDYEFIGLSLAFSSQFLFSLILSHYIRRKNLKIKIIWGGNLVSYYHESLLNFFTDYHLVNYFIVGDGETALYQLINREKKEKIYNLLYLKNNRYYYSSNLGYCEDINKLPSPKFESDDSYYALRSTSRCYWNKCNFCRYDKNSSLQLNVNRKIDKVFEDIRSNNKNNKRYYFMDSCLTISFLKNFSKKVIEENDISRAFSACLRFEPSLSYDVLKTARDAGFGRNNDGVEKISDQLVFNKLYLGLETTIPRLQKIINKGIDLRVAKRVLNDCNKLKICVLLLVILGIPTQTEEELRQDLDNLLSLMEKNSNIIISCNYFGLYKDTPFYNQSLDYGIKIREEGYSFLGSAKFDMINERHLSPERAKSIYEDYVRNLPKNKQIYFKLFFHIEKYI